MTDPNYVEPDDDIDVRRRDVDMDVERHVYLDGDDIDTRSHVDWGAILAGLVTALALQAFFTLGGLAWGFGTIDPADEANPLSGLLMGGGLYWAFTSIASTFAGAWVAARVSGNPYAPSGIIHGVVVWGLSTLLALWLGASALTSAASTAASAAGNVIEAGVNNADEAAGAVSAVTGEVADALPLGQLEAQLEEATGAQDLTRQDIRNEAREMLREVVGPQERNRIGNIAQNTATDILRTPGDFSSDISTGIDRLFRANGPLGDDDRRELRNAIAERFDVSPREAERIVNRWETRVQEAAAEVEDAAAAAAQQAEEAAQAATDAVSNALLGAFILSLLGLIAAAIGGALGRPEPVEIVDLD